MLNYNARNNPNFQTVGEYRKSRGGNYKLIIAIKKVTFYDRTNNIPESICSKPCKPGQKVSVSLVTLKVQTLSR